MMAWAGLREEVTIMLFRAGRNEGEGWDWIGPHISACMARVVQRKQLLGSSIYNAGRTVL